MRRIFSEVFAEIGSSWVPYTTFQAVPILASNSRRYSYSKNDSPLSPIWGVVDSVYRRLPASPIRRVGYWIFLLKKTLRINDTESRRLSAPGIRWVADSPYCWVGESPTSRIPDTESWRLRALLSRGVDDSAERWYRESLFKEKINLVSIFRAFNG